MITTSLNPLNDNLTSTIASSGALLAVANHHPNTTTVVPYDTNVPELLMAENNTNSTTSGPSSAEEAVFLPTFPTLPTTKLEEEPNPFEQSFEATTITTTTAAPIKLSPPTFLSEPTHSSSNSSSSATTTVVRRPIKYELETTTFYNHTYENPPPTVNRNQMKQTRKSSTNSEISSKKQKINNHGDEDEEKRKNFLERNRIAALKCRQRKKQWLQNLQTKVEYLAADNEQYHLQANQLREELINLKTLLMAHKDCPISQQELKIALNRPIPGVPHLPHLLDKKEE